MPTDPYAVLRALLRAEAVRNTPKPQPEPRPAPDAPQMQAPPPRSTETASTGNGEATVPPVGGAVASPPDS